MMEKKTKIGFIVAGVLILIGIAIFVTALGMLNWDFKNLSTIQYETSTYAISEDFHDLSVVTDTADIRFLPAEDGKCTVICEEEDNAKHAVEVKDGKLTITLQNKKAWRDYIGINFRSPKIVVYLPQEQYGDVKIQGSTCDVDITKDFSFASLDISVSTGDVKNYASASGSVKIKTSTGHISVEKISAGTLELKVNTGDVTVCEVTCEDDVKLTVSTGNASLSGILCSNLTTNGDTGDLFLSNVIATGKFCIERTTGDVKFDACDAAELMVETDTGDVIGSLLSAKIFFAEAETGSVHVPKTTTGGRCEITTSTGDIRITIE